MTEQQMIHLVRVVLCPIRFRLWADAQVIRG